MKKQRGGVFCKGRVRFYDSQKNKFGFIQVDSSERQSIEADIFFKESALRNPSKVPVDGENIYCFVQEGKKGYFSNQVIQVGELSSSECLKYLKLLHTQDFSLLVNRIISGEFDSYHEITPILENAIDRYQSHDPATWKFISKYGDDNQLSLLTSYFSELTFSQKLKLSTASEELFNHFNSIITDLSSSETVELVSHLLAQNKSKHISDDLWREYLKYQESMCENIIHLLHSGFKADLTVKHFSWTAKDVRHLLEYYETRDILIQEGLVSAIFQHHFDNFTFENHSFWNHDDSYTKFVERVLNQNVSSDFITDFTQRNVNYLSRSTFEDALKLVSEVHKTAGTDHNTVLSDFYSSIRNGFKSDLFTSLEDETLINNYWKLKDLGFTKDISQFIRRSTAIKLFRIDENIDIDFSKDYKYLNQADFESQRNFIFQLSKTAKEDRGLLFWKVMNKLKSQILDPASSSFDPSTVFILFLILQVGHKARSGDIELNANEIFKFIYKDLISENLIEYKLNGYFDRCQGRVFAIKSYGNSSKRTKDIPCDFCEGKLMTNRQTGQPAIDERTETKMYWCRNHVCLAPSRYDQNDEISLSGILNHIGYKNTDELMGFVNGWINKINSYLAHLTCRSCNKVLVPKDTGSGYYRVSYFYCNNSECDKHGEDNFVYLTHCVNPKCEEIIDSRDSAQCENNWYICAHCLACCSTKKIQNRIKYHTLSNNTYGGPTKGHKEEGKIFCPHCEKLIASGNSLQGYRKMLLKFKSQGTNHPNVIRIGQRKNDNKYWFLLKKLPDTSSAEFGQNVVKLKKLGFNIADTYKPGAETALVSERFSNDDLICSSCSLSISTSMLYRKGNYYRARAIEKWHDKIFT